jgi:hypothetical protein
MEISSHNNDIEELKEKYAQTAQPKPSIRKSPLAKKLLIKGESGREFENFRTDLLKELCPQTKIENFLAEKIIVCAWRLQRATIAERHLLNKQNAISEEERESFGGYGDLPPRKRIRNITRIDLAQEDAKYLAEQQIELQKVINKTLERLRAEQRRNQQAPAKP